MKIDINLPTLKGLPLTGIKNGIGGAAIGAFITGNFANPSVSIWATVCAISAVAGEILYLAINAATNITDLKNKHRLFVCTNLIGDAILIVALRQFNLLTNLGTAIITALALSSNIILLSQ